jgi:hypothetical protein
MCGLLRVAGDWVGVPILYRFFLPRTRVHEQLALSLGDYLVTLLYDYYTLSRTALVARVLLRNV